MSYFVIHNDEQLGPFQVEGIKSLLETGELDFADLCWREGWRQWRPIGSVAALAPADAFAKAPENFESHGEVFEDRLTRRRHASSAWTIGLAVLLIFALAGVGVLSVLLSDARDRIRDLEEGGSAPDLIERAMASRLFELGSPVPADEIKVWMTYLDPLTKRPVPVSRGNVLLYPAESVAAPLKALAGRSTGGIDSLLAAVQKALPPPNRETITDSEGFAGFSELAPGDYVVVAFTMKISDAGESPCLWIAKCRLEGHPHAVLVFSESNLADWGSGLEAIGLGGGEAP